MDLAEKIHRALYKKSGTASANNDPDFLKGYGAGKESAEDPGDDIMREWQARGEPTLDAAGWHGFAEWKRGYWAARLQRVCAKSIG